MVSCCRRAGKLPAFIIPLELGLCDLDGFVFIGWRGIARTIIASVTVCVNARLVDDRFCHIAFFGFQIVCRQLIVKIIFDKVSFCTVLGKIGIYAVNKDIVFTVCFKDVQLLIHIQFGYHRPVELVDLIFFIALDFALGIIHRFRTDHTVHIGHRDFRYASVKRTCGLNDIHLRDVSTARLVF